MHSQSYKEKGSRYCGHQERRIAKGKLFKDSNEMTIGYKEIMICGMKKNILILRSY